MAKAVVASVFLIVVAHLGQLSPNVVRAADPIKRGLKERDFPRTIKVTDSVYTYEDFHSGAEKFTVTDNKALQAVIAEATRLYKAGVPMEEAVKQTNFGEYSSWTLATVQGPTTIREVYEELSGQLK